MGKKPNAFLDFCKLCVEDVKKPCHKNARLRDEAQAVAGSIRHRDQGNLKIPIAWGFGGKQ